MPPLLRPLAPSDSSPLWSIARDVFLDGTTYAPDEAMTEAAFLGDWTGRGGEQWVAESEGRLLGAYTVRRNQPGRGAHVATASYLVDAAARGQGVGRLLGEHSIVRARALGFAAIQFNFVVSTNLPAVRLWQALRFRILATLPGAFRHRSAGPVDAYVMWLDLR
jgi:ribosomal protein S18 acetylase RimI-like enzyme